MTFITDAKEFIRDLGRVRGDRGFTLWNDPDVPGPITISLTFHCGNATSLRGRLSQGRFSAVLFNSFNIII